MSTIKISQCVNKKFLFRNFWTKFNLYHVQRVIMKCRRDGISNTWNFTSGDMGIVNWRVVLWSPSRCVLQYVSFVYLVVSIMFSLYHLFGKFLYLWIKRTSMLQKLSKRCYCEIYKNVLFSTLTQQTSCRLRFWNRDKKRQNSRFF